MSHCDCECVGEQSENEKVSWLSVIYIKKQQLKPFPLWVCYNLQNYPHYTSFDYNIKVLLHSYTDFVSLVVSLLEVVSRLEFASLLFLRHRYPIMPKITATETPVAPIIQPIMSFIVIV